MSKEKQIEREYCYDCIHYCACLRNGEYLPTPCSLYENKAGYRNQSEGEWIVTYEYNEYRKRKEAKITCSVCGHKPKYEGYLFDMNFCNKCGAEMKGGAE